MIIRKDLLITFLTAFGQIFLIGVQTYNIIHFQFLFAALVSLFITMCNINNTHVFFKDRIHQSIYAIGALIGIEFAMLFNKFIIDGR